MKNCETCVYGEYPTHFEPCNTCFERLAEEQEFSMWKGEEGNEKDM